MEAYEYEVMAAVEHDHWWYRGMRALAAAWLEPLYGGRADRWILDAGCGTGGNADFLRRYGMVAGLDLAALALRLGARRVPGRLQRGSVLALPYRDASFDLVTSFDVLYHRAVIDEDLAVREAWRVLRPGGRLLVRLPAYRWLSSRHDRSVHGRYRYTLGEARALLARNGFVVERSTYINSLLFPLALAQRLAERVRPAAPGAGSEMRPPPPLLNRLFGLALWLEAAWLRRGRTFPAGLSVMALGRKP